MKNYKTLKYLGIVTALLGLFSTLGSQPFGPMMMAFGITFASFAIFKDEKQNNKAYGIILAVALVIMLISESFIVPMQNTAFYLLLLVMSLGIFLSFYFSLKPQNLLTQREKILAWTGSALFGISLFSSLGLINNDFTMPLVLGPFLLIIIAIMWLIRRRIFKDNALKNEFNEVSTKKDIKEHWFKYEVGGLPKPVRWQGWVCYSIIFLSFLVVLIFASDPTIATIILVACVFIVTIIAMLKSNFRESVMEYRENLKK